MSKINIIYLVPELKGAAGGAKVVYDHSFILNNINNSVESEILHLKKNLLYKLKLSLEKKLSLSDTKSSGWDGAKMKVAKNFLPNKNWYYKEIKTAKNLQFNNKKDFVIIPEIFSHFAIDLNLKKKNIKYGIFVQGSYHMNTTSDFKKIKSSYENANIIIVSSDNSKDFVNQLFPKCKNKIFKVSISVDSLRYDKKNKKENFITCMPRKLPVHYLLLDFYLKNKLPKNWKIDRLDNIDEKTLIHKINRSKIFLSFSHLEGLGLPPIEAALAKNLVIGYNGGGGKEYWKKPIFHEIKYGEIKEFGDKILKEINNYNTQWIKKTTLQRTQLLNRYSKKTEKKMLVALSNKITNFFN